MEIPRARPSLNGRDAASSMTLTCLNLRSGTQRCPTCAARHHAATHHAATDRGATHHAVVSGPARLRCDVTGLHFLFSLSSHVPFTSTFRFRGACARADDSVPCCCRPREGWAERREAPALNGRARRARRHACEAWAVPRNRDAASRRSTVALSAQGRFRLRHCCRLRCEGSTPPGKRAGRGPGRLVSAVTSRGRRHSPLRRQDCLRRRPSLLTYGMDAIRSQ